MDQLAGIISGYQLDAVAAAVAMATLAIALSAIRLVRNKI